MFSRHFLPFALLVALFALFGCEEVDYNTDLDCEANAAAMETAVVEVLIAGEGCVNDAECVMFDTSNACYGTCPVAVNSRDLGWLTVTIEESESLYCEDFETMCSYEEPADCTAVRPVCQAGRCSVMAF